MKKKLISVGGERRIPNRYEGFNHLLNSCVMRRLRYVLPFLRMDFRVLDLGCGMGWSTKYCSLYCKEIVGIDLSGEALEFAQYYNGASNISWMSHTMTDLYCFEDGEFDLIYSTAALEHLEKSQWEWLMKECSRILNEEAFFVGTMSGFHKESKEKATKWHKWEPSIIDFKRMALPYFKTVKIGNFAINTPDLAKAVTEGYFILRKVTE